MLNNRLGGYSFGYTTDGKPGYKERDADTVVPFSSVQVKSVNATSVTGANISYQVEKGFDNCFTTFPAGGFVDYEGISSTALYFSYSYDKNSGVIK